MDQHLYRGYIEQSDVCLNDHGSLLQIKCIWHAVHNQAQSCGSVGHLYQCPCHLFECLSQNHLHGTKFQMLQSPGILILPVLQLSDQANEPHCLKTRHSCPRCAWFLAPSSEGLLYACRHEIRNRFCPVSQEHSAVRLLLSS